MTDIEIEAFVEAAARAAGIVIEPAQRAATLANFARIAAMAAQVEGLELGADVEPAPVFRHD